MGDLHLDVLTQRVTVATGDAQVESVVSDIFGAFASPHPGLTALALRVEPSRVAFRVETGAGQSIECPTLSRAIHVVDKEIVVAAQRHRPDLLFIHAAVVSLGGRAMVFAGDSGSGKSTLCWALCQAGLGFLSDEVAPIDPATLSVQPYPRALGLKRVLPDMVLPTGTRRLEQSIHVPARELGGAAPARLPLGSLFFVQHDANAGTARLEPLSAAEAAARLYVLCLNALAHEAAGLDATVRIAASVPAYVLTTGALEATAQQVRAFLTAA